jgi:hypothetical protein
MSDFMNGLTLSELFYVEAARPILESHFPEMLYSAALIGLEFRSVRLRRR